MVDEISKDLIFLFSVEASDIEVQHCELLKVHHIAFVSSYPVEPPVWCVIFFVEGGVRLLLLPMILFWQGFDELYLSVIVVSSTADVIVVPSLYQIAVSATHKDFLSFLHYLVWKIRFSYFLLTKLIN